MHQTYEHSAEQKLTRLKRKRRWYVLMLMQVRSSAKQDHFRQLARRMDEKIAYQRLLVYSCRWSN